MNEDSRPPHQEVSPEVVRELASSRLWVFFVALVLYAVAALSVFTLLLAPVWLTDPLSEASPEFVICFYILMALVFGVPAFSLHRYATAIQVLRNAPTTQALAIAMRRQTQFWRLAGVIIVVPLALLVVGAVLSVAL